MESFFKLRSRTKNKIDSLLKIDSVFLDQQNVKALVLDYDGVLAAEREVELAYEVRTWLENISKIVPVFILSNDPNNDRYNYFLENFNNIMFIRGVRRKPSVDGLLVAHYITKIGLENILIVDDRVLTGIRSADILGTQSLLYYPAKSKSFSLENFIDKTFRLLEKLFFHKS